LAQSVQRGNATLGFSASRYNGQRVKIAIWSAGDIGYEKQNALFPLWGLYVFIQFQEE